MPERRSLGSKQSSGRITLRDVAREAGVSPSTASRALNGSRLVSPETRAGVLRVVARLEFAPDPLARALNAGGTNTVGAVIPTINHAIFAAFLEALEAGLDSNGYCLVIATTGTDPRVELERARSLLEMGARALIVSGLDHESELISMAKRFGAPVVATSIYEASTSLPTIGYDNAELARQAMRHLLELGHTDVALVHGPTAQNDRTRLRISGAEARRGRTFATKDGDGAERQGRRHRREAALVVGTKALGAALRLRSHRARGDVCASAERPSRAPGYVRHGVRQHLLVRTQLPASDLHELACSRDGPRERASDLQPPRGGRADSLGSVAGRDQGARLHMPTVGRVWRGGQARISRGSDRRPPYCCRTDPSAASTWNGFLRANAFMLLTWRWCPAKWYRRFSPGADGRAIHSSSDLRPPPTVPAARLPRWVNRDPPRGFAPRSARRYTKPRGSPLL